MSLENMGEVAPMSTPPGSMAISDVDSMEHGTCGMECEKCPEILYRKDDEYQLYANLDGYLCTAKAGSHTNTDNARRSFVFDSASGILRLIDGKQVFARGDEARVAPEGAHDNISDELRRWTRSEAGVFSLVADGRQLYIDEEEWARVGPPDEGENTNKAKREWSSVPVCFYSSTLQQDQKELLVEVQQSLINGSVGWDKSVQVMELCHLHVDAPEVVEFMDSCLVQIVDILLDQQVGKIGHHERRCVERALRGACQAAAARVARGRADAAALGALAAALDKRRPLYKGAKTYWSSLPGAPEVRAQLVQLLAAGPGGGRPGLFEDVAAALERHQMGENTPSQGAVLGWQSAHFARVMLIAAMDAAGQFDGDGPDEDPAGQAMAAMCQALMAQMQALDGPALKKEPNADMSALLGALRAAAEGTPLEGAVFEAGARLALRYLAAASLPLRLFGLEQLPELMAAAAARRPPPRAYLVAGAGMEEANGRYEFAGDVENPPPKYCKELPNGTTLTLFRCTMRSRAKWWFISEADAVSPGTDKDVDYYQHRSRPDEEHEPPEAGWATCTSQGSAGVDPPPRLTSVGLLCAPGAEADTPEHRLLGWVAEGKVLELCFGPGIHREVVNRSTCVLRFLNRMGALRAEHLALVWRAAVGKQEAELQDEVYGLLAGLAPLVKEELLVGLLATVQDSIDEAFSEVVDLTEKISRENLNLLISTRPQTRSSLLKLLWTLLLKPEITKEKAYEDLMQFFLQTIRCVEDVSASRAFMAEALALVRRAAEAPAAAAAAPDEGALRQALRLLTALLGALPAAARPRELRALHEREGLSALLFAELAAFKRRRGGGGEDGAALGAGKSNHSLHDLAGGPDAAAAATGGGGGDALEERLALLAAAHRGAGGPGGGAGGGGGGGGLGLAPLRALWGLLSAPPERERLLDFLLAGAALEGNQGGQGQAAVAASDLGPIFCELVCDEQLDWAELGPRAFSCFQAYYGDLCLAAAAPGGDPAPAATGLRTLWRVAVSARRAPVPRLAARRLLQAYRAPTPGAGGPAAFGGRNPNAHFVETAFGYLARAEEDLGGPRPAAGGGAAAAAPAALAAERVLGLLTEAVGALAAQWAAGAGLAHGVRGTGARLTLAVRAKRIGKPPLYSPGAYQPRQTYESLEPFSVAVHPLDTIGSLRAKCAAAGQHPAATTRLLVAQQALLDDGQRVCQAGLREGSVLQVFYVAQPPQQPAAPRAAAAAGARGGGAGRRASLGDELAAEGEGAGGPAGGGGPGARGRGRFATLFGLLAAAARARQPRVARAAWALLLLLPTQASALRRVALAGLGHLTEDSVDLGEEEEQLALAGWEQLLPAAAAEWHRAVYHLQIVDAMLQPAAAALELAEGGEEDAAWARQAAAFRQGFVETGGFPRVLAIFMQAQTEAVGDAAMGNAVALRILKFCLFGPEEGDAASERPSLPATPASLAPSADAGADTGAGAAATSSPGPEEAALRQQLLGSIDMGAFLQKLLETALAAGETGPPPAAATAAKPSFDSSDEDSDIDSEAPAPAADPEAEAEAGTSVSGAAQQMALDALVTAQLVLNGAAPAAAEGLVAKLPGALVAGLVQRLLAQCPSKAVRVRAGRALGAHPALRRAAAPHLVAAVAAVDPASAVPPRQLFAAVEQAVAGAAADGAEAARLLPRLAEALAGKLVALSEAAAGGGGRARRGAAAAAAANPAVLNGCLALAGALLDAAGAGGGGGGAALLSGTALGPDPAAVARLLFERFLFRVPSEAAPGARAVCAAPESRRLGFRALGALARRDRGAFAELLRLAEGFFGTVAPGLRYRWGYGCSFDAKPPGTAYVGLKNQGCTCYMNSLLQNLFMQPALRQCVLSAEVKKTWQVNLPPEALQGRMLKVEWENGNWLDALVVNYDPRTERHTLKYADEEEAQLVLAEGRQGKETGAHRLAEAEAAAAAGEGGGEGEEEDKAARKARERAREAEEAARVLEQVQRTFMYLQSSERRYFDPRALVEACKCLNLNYNVYQQNDASEFCDKLLDRIETALKGQPQAREFQRIFGGRMVAQKIPRGCMHRADRAEPFVRAELIIRGKESIEESLAAYVEGELMEGDNKVECEECGEKKDTMRRTCFGTLPNCLVLHLKRFDLDYTTFETVKLNDRCAFPETLNLKPYTKEGIEAREAAEAAAREKGGEGEGSERPEEEEEAPPGGAGPPEEGAAAAAAAGEDGLDARDYAYELHGVLVHSGVAQGGHYYSFVKDPDGSAWHRFDDEDVTPWDVKNLEAACYGGTHTRTSTFQGVTNTIEQERMANGLLLFYNKIVPRVDDGKDDEKESEEPPSGAGAMETKEADEEQQALQRRASGLPLPAPGVATGLAAFGPEVRRANVTYLLHQHAFDPEIHTLLGGLLDQALAPLAEGGAGEGAGPATGEVDEGALVAAFRMGVTFLLDVLLHSRERVGVDRWARQLAAAARASPAARGWFLDRLAGGGGEGAAAAAPAPWAREYLLESPDGLARSFLVKFTAACVGACAEEPAEEELLKRAAASALAAATGGGGEAGAGRAEAGGVPALAGAPAALLARSRCARAVELAAALVGEAQAYPGTADDVFALVGALAACAPAVRRYLVAREFPARLAAFVLKERAPKAVAAALRGVVDPRGAPALPDFLHVLEATAALLGARQAGKAPLLAEAHTQGGEGSYSRWGQQQAELAPAARAALAAVFEEQCRPHFRPLGMDTGDVLKYMERCQHAVGNVTHFQLKQMLAKYHTLPDGRLSKEGFLQYYRDTAERNPKQVWSDLYQFGYNSDLVRAGPEQSAGEAAPAADAAAAPSSSAAAAAALFEEGGGGAPGGERVALPPLSEQALSCAAFYEAALVDPAGQAAAGRAVLRGACRGNLPASQALVRDCLEELAHLDPGWQGQRAGLAYQAVFTHLLGIKDQFSEKRMELIFGGDFGLFNAAMERVKQTNQYPNDYQQTRHVYRLIGLIKHLRGAAGPACRQWLDARREQWAWLEQHAPRGGGGGGGAGGLGGGPGYGRGGADSDDEYGGGAAGGGGGGYAVPAAVRVEGAGHPAVNGVYRRTQDNDGTCAFMSSMSAENPDVFTLYRCKMNNGSHQWYISIVPPNKQPGTNADIDFYYAPSRARTGGFETPPQDWLQCNGNPDAVLPNPMVTISASTQELYGDKEFITPSDDEDDLILDTVNQEDDPMNNSTGAMHSGSESDHTTPNSSPHDHSMDSGADGSAAGGGTTAFI